MAWTSAPTRRTDLLLALGVFALAMIVSLIFWSLLPAEYQDNQSTDFTLFYEPVARNIADGQGVVLDGEIATRYPPGFPILVAATFGLGDAIGLSNESALTWFRLLCAGLSAVLIFAISRLVWRPIPALFVAGVWATYPFGLWLTKQPNSEIAFIPLLLASVYLLWRALLRKPHAWWLFLGAGMLAGGAMLVRAAGIGLGFVFAFLILLLAGRSVSWKYKFGMAALVLLGNMLVVVPWQSTVYSQTGHFIPLSSGGAITIKDGLTFLAIPKDYRREVPVAEDVAAMMQSFHERRSEMNTMGGVVDVVMDEARQDPTAFIKIIGIKATRSWYGIDSRQFEGPTLILQVIYLALAIWGSIYAWRRGDGLRKMIAGNWVIVGYFWAMTLLVVPLLRYTLPVMGLLMISLPGVYYSLVEMTTRRAAAPAQLPDTNL